MGETPWRNSKDKVCVVTGGAGSIGLASAKLFAAEGGKVMLVDRDPRALAKAAARLCRAGQRRHLRRRCRRHPMPPKNYLNATVSRFGKIDVIFSNAGMSGAIAPVTDYPDELFDRVMAVNVRASFLACKYGLPLMNDGGSIIITSSIMGVSSAPAIVGYATSKHAVIGLMKVVAKEAAAPPHPLQCAGARAGRQFVPGRHRGAHLATPSEPTPPP